jgi:type II secretory pathway predicted ATPase ExeA
MFEQFFGFTAAPFARDLPCADLFLSASLKELADRFSYIRDKRGLMLLCGEPGTGKTTALRHFIESLSPQAFFPIYLPLSTVSPADFYRQINLALKGDPLFFKSLAFQSIQKQILQLAVHKKIIPVIILDEAHLLKDNNFKELQIITNFSCDTMDPAIFLLAGHDVLLERLQNKRSLLSFYQRLSLKYRLLPLTKPETRDYVKHHLKLVKCQEELLTESAYESLFKLTEGNPRLIGSLLTKCFIYCMQKNKHKITEEEILACSPEAL